MSPPARRATSSKKSASKKTASKKTASGAKSTTRKTATKTPAPKAAAKPATKKTPRKKSTAKTRVAKTAPAEPAPKKRAAASAERPTRARKTAASPGASAEPTAPPTAPVKRASGPARAKTAETAELPTLPKRLSLKAAAAQLGIEELRPEQEQAVRASLRGRDVLLVVPTGYGKSACYQLPALMRDHLVLVVSPLLALLEDQERRMERAEIPALRIDGRVRGKKRERALEALAAGTYRLVMTTPESLEAPDLQAALVKRGIGLAAVDEAHCLSEWGHDFRPAYRSLGTLLQTLGGPPILALTATATPSVRDITIESLGMTKPLVIALSPHRSNLAFDLIRCSGDDRFRAVIRLAQRLRRPGLVYCSTRREVDAVYALLSSFRIRTHRYHAGMNSADRQREQRSFMSRRRRSIMVATSAFGLGIDKRDLRYVIHFQAPASLEQYVQEAGRCGRDGRRAHCILLYDSEDRVIHEALQTRSRIHPSQLRRLGSGLLAWWKEGRAPDRHALAVSSEIGERSAAALLAKIEEAGLVETTPEGIRPGVVQEEFADGLRELASQFDTLRIEDGHRLDAIAAYAEEEGCRARHLQRYFGEPDPDDCGLCDRCRGAEERPATFFEAVERRDRPVTIRRRKEDLVKAKAKAKAKAQAKAKKKSPRKRRRRRRPRRRRGQSAKSGPS